MTIFGINTFGSSIGHILCNHIEIIVVLTIYKKNIVEMKFIYFFCINTFGSSIGHILCIHNVIIVVLTIYGKTWLK